jgi:hypothetical protein
MHEHTQPKLHVLAVIQLNTGLLLERSSDKISIRKKKGRSILFDELTLKFLNDSCKVGNLFLWA